MASVDSRMNRLKSVREIAKSQKNNHCKIIILNDLASLWLAPVFKYYGFNVISLLHLYLQKKSQNRLGHTNMEYYLLKFSAKFCNNIFSVNKENQEVFGKSSVKFIGNYVPSWFFDQKPYSKEKKYDFIIVARLALQKNIPLFLKLLKNINNQNNNKCNVLIVGDGPEKQNIHQLVKDLNLTEFVDYTEWVERKNLPMIFDKGKCFVISSHHEGFATTLLEAHARGLPAIVTRSAGFCAEFIEGYNSKTGIIFSQNDVDSTDFLNSVMEMIYNNEQYYSNCIEKAKVFSEENVLSPILKSIQALSKKKQ
jgi:glycosyltransferase involved in cell wall biosynthesis